MNGGYFFLEIVSDFQLQTLIYCVDLVSTDSLRKPTLIQASNKKQRKGPVLTHEFKCYRTREQG